MSWRDLHCGELRSEHIGKRLTVAYYMQALVTHDMPQDSSMSLLLQIFHEVPSVAVSLSVLAAVVAMALWLSGRAVEEREYVLEQ